MPFVVDASIAACWLMPDERHTAADAAYHRLATDSAIAPGLWWFELRNMFIVNERRGRIESGKTTMALRLLGALPVILDYSADEDVLMQLARKHRLTVYDAAYLELAVRTGFHLATLDKALGAAATAETVHLIA